MPVRRFIWVAMWLLVCVTVASGQTRQPPITVAVMAGDDAPPGVEVFAAALTTVLRDQSITLIDRSRMRKLLAEHELSVGGVIRDPLAIGKMIGAQYLIYLAGVNSPAQSQPVVLMMIEVNSGNVLAETACADDEAEALGKTLADAIAQARQLAEQPAATVLSVIDRSDSQRIRFLQATLVGTLDRMIEQRGWRMLRRSHALELSKETTLSTAGLMRPDAEVLARAADLVVSAEFREQPSPDKAFEQVPIELTLSLKQNGRMTEKRITFTLDALGQLERELGEAIPVCGGKPVDVPKPGAAEATKLDPRLEAAQLLAKLDRRFPDRLKPEDRMRQAELCRRIIYLDPSSAEGYYRLGVSQTYLAHNRFTPEQSRALAEECRYALVRFLQFPRTQREWVGPAFYGLQQTLGHLMHLSRNDPTALDRLCEQGLAVVIDFTNWYTTVDWDGKLSRYTTLRPLICTDYYFQSWFAGQPKRRADFYGWLAERVASNPALPALMKRTAEMEAAHFYDQAGDLKRAADFFHRTASRLQDWDGKDYRFQCWGLSPDYATTVTIDRYAEYLTADQRELLRRLLPEPVHHKPSAGPMAMMYGDYFGKIYSTDGMIRDEFVDAFWLKRSEYETVSPEKTEGPAGVIFTPQLFQTRDALWAVGASGPSASEPLLTFGLYQTDLKNGVLAGSWRRVAIPEGMTMTRANWSDEQSPVIGALQIAMMVQVGDEVLWCGGAMAGGKATDRTVVEQSQPLFVYNLKTGQLRTVGLAEGLPENQVAGVYPAADGQSAWIVTKSGFLTRYHEGKLYLMDRRPCRASIGWTFTPRRTLALESPAGSAVWMGEADGGKMREVLQGWKANLALLPGSCFRVSYDSRGMELVDLIHMRGDGATALGDGDSFVVNGDDVYLPCSYGLLVMSEKDGRIKHIWRKNLFCNFRYLAGFLEGNSPLPPARIVKMVVDEHRPTRLWIISRHKYMVAHIGDRRITEQWEKRGLSFPRVSHPPRFSSPQTHTYENGLFITAFDTETQCWSRPRFVAGDIAAAVPVGEDWYFAGLDWGRLSKSLWVCDQKYDPDAKPEFLTADTLHGRAARALYNNDIDEAKRLLLQAIDEDIAVESTRKMVEQLDALRGSRKR